MLSLMSDMLYWILSAADRTAITRKWLKPEIPTIDDWTGTIYNIYRMERITFTIRQQQNKFLKKWESWIVHIIPYQPSFVECKLLSFVVFIYNALSPCKVIRVSWRHTLILFSKFVFCITILSYRRQRYSISVSPVSMFTLFSGNLIYYNQIKIEQPI